MESLRDNLVSEINQLQPKSPRTQIVLEPPRAEQRFCASGLSELRHQSHRMKSLHKDAK